MHPFKKNKYNYVPLTGVDANGDNKVRRLSLGDIFLITGFKTDPITQNEMAASPSMSFCAVDLGRDPSHG
jgi:hypothetical protein